MSDFSLPGLLDPVAGIAMSQSISGWIYMGVGIIVYTLAGGIVLAILLKIMGSVGGKNYDIGKSFIVSLLASILTLGVGLLDLSVIPGPVLPVIIWILLLKMFFRGMAWLKILIAGVAGFFITRLAGDLILIYVMGIFFSLGI